MEKTATKEKSKKATADKLKKAYIEYVLLEGHQPTSIFAFAQKEKILESDFYEYFNSFDALEKHI
jgi:hypothetical protein